MRLDRLTNKFQLALADAQSLALGHDNQFIEPLHLMSALLNQEGGSVSPLLTSAGINAGQLRTDINQALNRLPQVEGTGGDVQPSQDLVRVLNLCDKLAQKRGDNFISSELFVLAALESRGTLADILKAAGATTANITQAIEQMRGGESVNDNWGLTERGFLRPSYADLLDAFEVKAKELFGSTVNLSVRSPLGIFLRIFAWFAGLTWQLAEDVYNSGFIDTAAGVSLARLGAFIGIRVLAAQKATGSITITGDAGATIYAGFIVQARNNQRFVTLEDVTIGSSGTATVPIQAFEAGPDGNVAAGTIDTVVTPLAAAISVTNAAATVGGRNRETDQEFRERYLSSVDKPGGSNTDAIRAQLLEVPGIVTAVVWENETDETDSDGLPPHSIEAIVYGGTDADIAVAIHARKAAGIQTYGGQSAQVLDASGKLRMIKFSRPTPVPIYVQISELVTSDAYSGDAALKAAIVEYIGSAAGDIAESGLAIGETVYYNRLMCPVNNTPGVVDYTLKVSTDGKTWSKNNIAIDARKKAITGTDKVVIVT